jgi:hypothetical protein
MVLEDLVLARKASDAVRELKKVFFGVDWWNARASCGAFAARRPGPARSVMVNMVNGFALGGMGEIDDCTSRGNECRFEVLR